MSADRGELPDPPIARDTDCTDLDGFMLNVERLMASELVALSSHEVLGAALLIWCRAWKQVPAASLPNDERVIAAFARMPIARFRKLRSEILRGFELCGDGRLYHRTLASEAANAYDRKLAFHRKRQGEADRLREWRQAKRAERSNASERVQPSGSTPSKARCETPGETRFETPGETRFETPGETRFETPHETRFVPEGQGQGQGQGHKSSLGALKASAIDLEGARGAATDVRNGSETAGQPTAAGEACRAMRQAGLIHTSPSDPRLLAALATGVTAAALADAAREAVERKKSFAWAIATAQGRLRDAVESTPGDQTNGHSNGSSTSRNLSAVERVAARIQRRAQSGETIEGSATRFDAGGALDDDGREVWQHMGEPVRR